MTLIKTSTNLYSVRVKKTETHWSNLGQSGDKCTNVTTISENLIGQRASLGR